MAKKSKAPKVEALGENIMLCVGGRGAMPRQKIKVSEKPEIVVHGEMGKPYYEIRYIRLGEKEPNVGYSSYHLDNCFRWLESEFEVVGEDTVGCPCPKLGGDAVKEPSHYQQGTFEVIDEMLIAFGVEKTVAFCQLNAWKYRARAPYKNKFEEDMAKANRYLEMAYDIQRIRQEYPEAESYEVCLLLKGRRGNEG